MSDKAEAGKKGGWFKAILGTIAGLFSGAFVMYLTPVIDKVVKPSKPVANFAVELQDFTATFHNRSTGASQGWWDFGDGSPLEPLNPQQEVVTHTYANPGIYTAKLSVRNLFGEESDRSVPVNLDPQRREPPQILSLQADAVSPGAYAPATFRVTSQARGAELAVWNLGDDRPLEFNADTPNRLDRLVTFPKPGGYVIKLAAVSGKQAVERSEVVWVEEPPHGTCAVVLSVSDAATRVETAEVPVTVSEAFPPGSKDAVRKIDRQVPARPGFQITAARVQPMTDAGAKNLRVEVAKDGRSARLLGELPRPTGKGTATLLAKVMTTQERRTPVSRPPVAVTATTTVPGNVVMALPPLPEGWVEAQRQVRLELRENDRVVWQGSQLPRGVPVQMHGRRCTVTAGQTGGQVRVELTELRGPAAN
jgi:hypothetical protein